MQNNKTFYFDTAATTPIDSEVIELMNRINQQYYGNPSSIHKAGQNSHNLIEKSRKSIAKYLHCHDSEIYFTSGGSESNNIVLKGILNSGDHFITSSYEHPSISKLLEYLETKNVEITVVKPNVNGLIEINSILNAIKENTKLVSIMYVNNELGTINPISEMAKVLSKKNILLHSDAVQYLGKGLLNMSSSNIDMLSIGAHKFYGPKGIGILYVKKGIKINPLINGGGQESGMRAGTENISAIVGMDFALQKACDNINAYTEKIKILESYFISSLDKNNIDYRINGENTVNGIINITFFGVDGHALLINLDMLNIAISYGSACSSGSVSAPGPLLEIGMNEEEAKNTVRISIGKMIEKDDIDYLVDAIVQIIRRIKK